MSNAKPMTSQARAFVYDDHSRELPTRRQARQMARMEAREEYRALGELKHGASGVPVRNPILRPSRKPTRGSFVTHAMVLCDRCPQHAPYNGFHRVPRRLLGGAA